MKKFKFRLERVLQYRQTVKSECQRELMLANNKLNAQIDHLEQLEQAQIANTAPEGVMADVSEFVMRSLYAARLKQEIIKQLQVIEDVKKVVETAREKYIEAAKEAKALEMLKDKKSKAYAEYVEQEDGKQMDELVIQRTARLEQRQDSI